MESGGDALKTGRVTSGLVQCPKLYPYISLIAEIESQPLSGCDGFIHFQQFVEESLQTIDVCTVSTIVEKLRLDRTGHFATLRS